MAAGPWLPMNQTITELLSAAYNVETAAFKMVLLLSTSNITAASTTYALLTNEHANQGAPGYVTAGKAMALSLTGTTTVKADVDTDPTWTATGGSIVAKWAAIYEVATDHLLCFCLLEAGGTNVTVTVGNDLTVAANVAGLFTVSV